VTWGGDARLGDAATLAALLFLALSLAPLLLVLALVRVVLDEVGEVVLLRPVVLILVLVAVPRAVVKDALEVAGVRILLALLAAAFVFAVRGLVVVVRGVRARPAGALAREEPPPLARLLGCRSLARPVRMAPVLVKEVEVVLRQRVRVGSRAGHRGTAWPSGGRPGEPGEPTGW
jgi:hypothetical protein